VADPGFPGRWIGRAHRIAFGALLLAIGISPSSLYVMGLDGSADVGYHALNLVDPLLLFIGLLALPVIFRTLLARDRSVQQRTVVGSFVLFAIISFASWCANPDSYGLFMVARLVGVAGVVCVMATSSEAQRRASVRVVIGVAVFEALVCAVQLVVDGPIGLGGLGESIDPFQRTDGWRAPAGTSFYPYPIVAIGMLGLGMVLAGPTLRVGRVWAYLSAVSAGVLVGFSGSLSAAVSVVGLVVCALGSVAGGSVARRSGRGFRNFRMPVLGLFVCALLGAGVVQQSVWLWKGDRTAAVDEGAATSGRSGQVKVAAEIAKGSPMLGIGPGRFQEVRNSRADLDRITPDRQISHSVPMLILSELGVFATLALAVSTVAALRSSGWAGPILGVSVGGYVAADIMHWYRGMGVLQIGLILGLLAAGVARRSTLHEDEFHSNDNADLSAGPSDPNLPSDQALASL
jgi:hypothetical protein